MKKIFIFLLLLACLTVQAKKIYVKSTGNDANTGLSDAQALLTVAHSYLHSIAGDSILFNRGDVWRESLKPLSGTAGHLTYYGAYGTGAKPKFLGSVAVNSGWTEISSNIWQNSNAALIHDVGILVFNNEESIGTKIMSATPTLDHQGDYWYDFNNHLVKLYSVSNPATFYSNIEAGLTLIGAWTNDWFTNYAYVTYENLDFRYWASNTIQCGSNDIYVKHVDVSFGGGGDMHSYFNSVPAYTEKTGNGIEIDGEVSNIFVEGCKIDNYYDYGIGMEGTGPFTRRDVYMRNNIISNCEYSLGFTSYTNGILMYNIFFEHNTCLYGGGGMTHFQRPNGVSGRHLAIWKNQYGSVIHDFYIRNNIFYEATEQLIRFTEAIDTASYIIDHNVMYQSSGDIATIWFTNYHTLAEWKAASGKDTHSIDDDPLFVSSTDFHLQLGSPAIDIGIRNGDLTDFDGHKFHSPLPSMGAYEYIIPYFITKNGVMQLHNGKPLINTH